MNFGQRLKSLLFIFNLNSRKLAIAIHVDPSSVSRWINNKRTLPPNNLIVDKIVDYILIPICTMLKNCCQEPAFAPKSFL